MDGTAQQRYPGAESAIKASGSRGDRRLGKRGPENSRVWAGDKRGRALGALLFVRAQNCVSCVLDATQHGAAARKSAALRRFLYEVDFEGKSQIGFAQVGHRVVTRHDILRMFRLYGNCRT